MAFKLSNLFSIESIHVIGSMQVFFRKPLRLLLQIRSVFFPEEMR
jgi:hypothetical protein